MTLTFSKCRELGSGKRPCLIKGQETHTSKFCKKECDLRLRVLYLNSGLFLYSFLLLQIV